VIRDNNAILEALLKKWGEWVFRREDAGLGYPKQSPYNTDTIINDQPRTAILPNVDLESMRIEELVNQLPTIHRAIIRAEYNPRLATKEGRWAYAGCGWKFYRTFLNDAKERLIALYNNRIS